MKKRIFFILIVIISSLGLVFTGLTITALRINSKAFGRIEDPPYNRFQTYFTWKEIDQDKYSREELRFHSGRNKLQAFVYGGSNNRGLIIISHGLGNTAENYLPMIMYFVDKGWRVFAFNNTGVSGSEGKGIRGLTQSLVDLDAALAYIENSAAFNGLPVMLIGHSWGGFAVCAALNHNPQVRAAVSFAGFNSCDEMINEVGVSSAGVAFYLISPQLWAIKRILFGNAAKLTAVDGINKAGIPVMIVQSSNDHVVSAKTTSIYAHRKKIINPNVEIIYLDGENATGHSYVFGSKKQHDYMSTANTGQSSENAEHNNSLKSLWSEQANFDKALANELDPELMERIDRFFNSAR